MKIIDEKPKKKLPELEPGDVIRTELENRTYYFMIGLFTLNLHSKFTLVQLDAAASGTITYDGAHTFDVDYHSNCYDEVDKLIDNLDKYGYKHIEKVELEARVKHEKD